MKNRESRIRYCQYQEVKPINRFTKVLIIIFAFCILSLQLKAETAFFSSEMEKYIRDGKEVNVMLEEGIKEIEIIPRNNLNLIRIDDNSSMVLEAGQSYFFKSVRGTDEYFKIQVFATGNREKADQLWLDLKNMGYEEIKVIHEDGLYKVRFGYFTEKSETEEAVAELKEQGWNPWVVRIAEQLPESIYIYNDKGERVFSGKMMSISGKLTLADNIFDGKTDFRMYKHEIQITHLTKLDYLVGGLVENSLNRVDNNLNINEQIKAYSIAVRTYILNNHIKNEQNVKDLQFNGLASSEIMEYVNLTEGIIVGRIGEDAVIEIAEIDFPAPDNYFDFDEIDFTYKELLEQLYINYNIIDLKEVSSARTIVDADVEWGLRYREIRQVNWQGPVVFTALDLDLNRNKFVVEPILAGDQISGLEDLATMVKDHGMLAGINGGYFHYSGRPLGLIYNDDKIISEPVKDRTSLILTDDNEVVFSRVNWHGYLETIYNRLELNGVNRKPGNGQITMFNSFYGEYAPVIKPGIVELIVIDGFIEEINYFKEESDEAKGSPIPTNGYIIQAHGRKVQYFVELNSGDFIDLQNIFDPDFEELNVQMAISAGPQLVKDGEEYISSEEEEFLSDITYGRAPRSAVGVTEDNHLVFFTVDGRQPEHSVGITLKQLSRFMRDYGITDGMNLDGGSSARMVVRGFTMNTPSGDRLISNGILIGKKE
ncbi:MAG: phosphodiester glycosidase family protein [Halanaerobiales bacterium]